MTRLSCIQELRSCTAMDAVEAAIETIRDWSDRWGEHMRRNDPEERAKTLRILGCLIELQANETAASVREGETKHIRETLAAQEEAEAEALSPAQQEAEVIGRAA